MHIGKEIRRLVNSDQERFSAEGFAEIFGYKNAQSYYDRTNANDFTIEELQKIAAWLKIPLSHFLMPFITEEMENNLPGPDAVQLLNKKYIEQRIEILERHVKELMEKTKKK